MSKRFRKMTALLLSVVMVTLMIPIPTISVSAGTVIENAISWALGIADDDSHGYSQLQNRRWGNPDYDCSTFVITAFANAGCDVEGATYTGNMRSVFENAGFTWIPKSQIDLSNSSQLVRGDILLNEANHTEIYIGNNQRVGAHTGTYDIYERNSPGDNNGREISIYNYSNSSNWDGVLRYNDEPDYVNVGDDFYAYIINTASWLLATNDNGNVNVSQESNSLNQVWHFSRLSNGSYKIVSYIDNNCMEVHNFEYTNGTNVEMHSYNDNSAQHWFIYGESGRYVFRAECGDNVLDLNGGAESAGNGTNLQMWESNGTDAQKFQIWKVDPANIHWYNNFSLVNLGDNFSARIRNVNLDVLLTNFSGNVVIGKHYDYKIARQIWNFSKNSNGSYRIKSCLNDNCMELHNFDDFDGGNIACIAENGSTAQNWFIYQNNEGSYYLRPECSQDRVIDVTEGNPTDGNNLQLWSYIGNSNQKFSIEKCGEVVNFGEDFSASIEHTNYWKPIFQNDNGNVELTTSSREKMSGILWHFIRDNDNGWYTIMSYKNGKYLEVADSSNAAGANVQCGDYNNSNGQHWYILKGIDSNGEYHYLKSACSSNNLDLDYNIIDDGTNIKMWSNTSSDAQKYSVYTIGGETTYNISTNNSNLTLGENAKLTINNTTFVTSYKFHFIQPNGEEMVIDNKCNYQYSFTPTQTGRYTVFCEVESPVSKSIGSPTDRFITINVSYKIGDTNLDGKITIRDVTAIQRHLVELETLNEEQLAVADTNGDGEINIADATHLQKYLAEFNVALGKQS